ncbi:Peptide transport system ATP-binding protein SapD [Bibersteinia trehalosi USDA-ARS-USMARC-188]|uniref:Peptide transport system ATP-binding protein SapD n=5 Tax=Bibersteinia trehalosi TaxID=47735 RepID=W0R5M3_BIBTR|nr:oligopeptide/dipeptide ABC transporter ATP-binding protein [Bibersteinia trehalosi]AGH38457.1 Peptide transport system ATP-binding protein SapD [Bibersteinia trehalosi USDA-ARS-USMARC-192]AHG81743.1 Peptide transport system ATP-binding protein SapD [Bibersteinia trehalosi USDA-ARS-USMARC-188]AHG84029.1 Peptide transport system ATP-binding protein SapD [Bibersteinia trehalosi USDA-ARS-USMARC-189]AHG86444.1 Peptide transport system ATP-binding protein SapD [Bibersteinia trehalosi USDA-ARS-USMA
MALLDIRHLSIEIDTPNGRIKMVDNINLTLDSGDVCGLVGESGSGKSLIAKVICGLVKDEWIVSADRFRFNDVELLKLSPHQRRQLVGGDISMIFQDPLSCLDPSQPIGKQLIQTILFKGKWWQFFTWRKRKAIELLHKVGIKDHQDIMQSYPCDITEGEAQKVMIAMAVANQPRLLVADEPTNTMEPSTRLQIYRLLSSMNKNLGTSIILVSNEIQSIYKWVDHFNVLYCGQTVEIADKETLMKSPYHPYTSVLLNSVPDFSNPLPFKSHLNSLKGAVPMLQNMPIGCRLGPRCPFAQRKCGQKPPLRKLKQHEFACHFPINFREQNLLRKEENIPIVVNEKEA